MGRYRGPKNRIARRFGVNCFNRKRNPLLHKSHPPGAHGAGRRRKKSDFGLQLHEKQKLKAVYGMLPEKKLVKNYREAVRQAGVTVDNLLRLLESRLDVVVFRLKFAPTIFAAQQLVSHGHIFVNGRRVNRRSFLVRPGMIISVRKKLAIVEESLEDTQRETPVYLSLNATTLSGEMVCYPESDQIPLPMEINVKTVCEFLAHTV